MDHPHIYIDDPYINKNMGEYEGRRCKYGDGPWKYGVVDENIGVINDDMGLSMKI